MDGRPLIFIDNRAEEEEKNNNNNSNNQLIRNALYDFSERSETINFTFKYPSVAQTV